MKMMAWPRRQRSLRVVAAGLSLSTGLAACLPERGGAPALPMPVVRQLMQSTTVPASNVVFAVADQVPADDAGWQQVQASAQGLVDVGVRLQVGARGARKEDWVRFAQAMVVGADQAVKAAAGRDSDALTTAGNQIFEACEACHRVFLNTATAVQAASRS